MKTMELLAPAGSPETLRAVLDAGADAAYVGGARFGARAYAKNFTEEELLAAIDYAHLHGKRLHLTVNTLLKNRELEEQLYDYLLPYYERGLDALIVQDAGVFSFVRQYFPELKLHVSTQMTVTGADGAGFWRDLGARRIVLARELSIAEIRRIHEQVDVELECFAHGALCYCYSGQCLFSSMLGGRSGNRGRCAQPCRLPYGVAGDVPPQRGAFYPLSMKDLCAIDLLPELFAAGVSSLKLEGRMKQTEYAAGVTAVYRKYLDMLAADGAENYAVAEEDWQRLFALGNRSGFTAGYLRGEKGRELLSLHSPKHSGSHTQVSETTAGEKRKLSGRFVCEPGKPVVLIVKDLQSNCTVSVQGGEAARALHAPATPAEVERVLRQTGETEFAFETLTVELAEGCFIPKQFLKALRRDALRGLSEELLRAFRRTAGQRPEENGGDASLKHIEEAERELETAEEPAKPDVLRLSVVCDTPAQLRVCVGKDYIETLILQLHSFSAQELCGAAKEAGALCRSQGKRLLLALPSVFRAETVEAYEKSWICIEKMQKSGAIDGFLAKNHDSLGFLRRMGVAEEQIVLDSFVYLFSDRAAAFFCGLGYRSYTLPLELNAGELRRRSNAGAALVIYGHTPFMVSSQCVNKNTIGCDRTEKLLYLKDRYGARFPVKNYCGVCYNIIYNALPTVLFDPAGLAEIKRLRPQTLRMDFSVEEEADVRAVLSAYERYALARGGNGALPEKYTRGHFKRGVE